MTKTYQAARKAYKAGQRPNLRVVENSGCYAWIEDQNGVGLEAFANAEHARVHLSRELDKAGKWIA